MLDKHHLTEFQSYLQNERGLSHNTQITYGHHLKSYLRFLEGENSSPADASTGLISKYGAVLRQRGLGTTTHFCAAIAIRLFHRFLLEKGYSRTDPTLGLRLPKLIPPVVEPLSVEEIERLMDAPSKYTFAGLRDRSILELLYCGLRISEALGLDITHLHMDEGYIKVLGKGSRERLVPIGIKGQEALKSYFEKRSLKLGGDSFGAIFLSRTGRRLGKNGFWRRFKRYALRAGMTRRVYPHLLRHSYAVHLLAGKADLRSLQLLLGHSSLTSTQRYLNLNHQALQEICRKSHPRF